MKASELIEELQNAIRNHGDIEVQIQSNPQHDGIGIVNDETVYVVPEKYEDGMRCNLRTWPY